jgi:cell division topological specificity factor
MRSLFSKLQDSFLGKSSGSKEDAKTRLKFLLIHDQVDLTPAQLECMRTEIMDVISKYVDVDNTEAEFSLNREDGQVALVSNIPVRRVTSARA